MISATDVSKLKVIPKKRAIANMPPMPGKTPSIIPTDVPPRTARIL
jgi:hypothetical protein